MTRSCSQEWAEEEKAIFQPSAAWEEQSLNPKSNQIVRQKKERNIADTLIIGQWLESNHRKIQILIFTFYMWQQTKNYKNYTLIKSLGGAQPWQGSQA